MDPQAGPSSADILIGQTVGNYLVTQKLGEGGMGSVYLAEHPSIGKKVALKVLHGEEARAVGVGGVSAADVRMNELDRLARVLDKPRHYRRLGWAPEDYDQWAQQLHRDQIAFIPPTKWDGETVGRFAFLHPHTPMWLVQEILDPNSALRGFAPEPPRASK